MKPTPKEFARHGGQAEQLAPLRNKFSVFATTPSTLSRFPASLVRFASSRSRTPAVLLFNDCRGLSFFREAMKTPRRRKRLSSAAIYRFVNRCRAEIKICERSKAYLAGTVLTGAAVEYILTVWIRAFDILKYAEHGKKLTDHWSLKELIDLAYQQGLFDFKAFRAAERIRKFRNLVHPNWFAGRKPARFTKDVLEARHRDYDHRHRQHSALHMNGALTNRYSDPLAASMLRKRL